MVVEKKSKGVSKITHVNLGEGKEMDSVKKTTKSDPEKVVKNEIISKTANRAEEKESRPKKTQLPSFLQNFGSNSHKKKKSKPSGHNDKVDGEQNSSDQNTAFSSISSMFNQSNSSISGVRRVFRKSLTTLILNTLLFATISVFSVKLFSINPLLLLISVIVYISVTVIFYVTVADRSYVWIGIAIQVLLILITSSFLGEGFSLITLVAATVVSLFNYLAYTEVEKLQLSSRLFSIGNVTKEAVRILGVGVVIVISLGLFNIILSKGSTSFMRDTIFTVSFIKDSVVVGQDTLFSKGIKQLTNNSYSDFAAIYQTTERDATFYDFLEKNYARANGGVILSNFEEQEQLDKIQEWADTDFSEISYTLETPLDVKKYSIVAEHFYIKQLDKFAYTQSSSSFEIIPRVYMIPAFFAFIFFALLMILKIVVSVFLNWVVIPLIWFVLKYSGFVRIDIEHVEAEVVSI